MMNGKCPGKQNRKENQQPVGEESEVTEATAVKNRKQGNRRSNAGGDRKSGT